MFARTSHVDAPWRILHTDTKKIARLELIRDLLASFDYPHKDEKITAPDQGVAFIWTETAGKHHKLSK